MSSETGVSASDVGQAFDPNLFYANSQYVGELNHKLHFVRLAINNAIDHIYSDVESLSNGWEGVSYNTYRNNMNSYRKYLMTFCIFIAAYRELLSTLSDNITTLETNIDTALDIG